MSIPLVKDASSEFKAKVALAAGDKSKSAADIAVEFGVPISQVEEWNNQLESRPLFSSDEISAVSHATAIFNDIERDTAIESVGASMAAYTKEKRSFFMQFDVELQYVDVMPAQLLICGLSREEHVRAVDYANSLLSEDQQIGCSGPLRGSSCDILKNADPNIGHSCLHEAYSVTFLEDARILSIKTGWPIFYLGRKDG